MSETSLADMANRLVDELGARETIVADVDDLIVDAIRGAVALRAVADDVLARLTSQAERVGVAKRAGMSARELLCRNGVAPAVAGRVIRLGRAIHVLPRLARHSRDASLSAEHLDAVARGIEHVVRRTGEDLDSEVIDALEGGLIGQAVAGTTPAEIVERARAVAIELTVTEPGDDGPDRVPPAEDSTLNELDWHQGDDGRLRGGFDLDALTAERFITALDAPSRPRPEPDGSHDPRPASLRRADAFGQLLECGTRGLSPDALSGPARTEVIVTIPVGATGTSEPGDAAARLGWMGPITDLTAKLASCDASVTGIGLDIHGVPLDVSATKRLFTGAVRKATPHPRSVLHQMRRTRLLDRRAPHQTLVRRRTDCPRQRLPALPDLSHRGPPHRVGRDHGRRPTPLVDPTHQHRPTTTTTPPYNRRTLRLDDPIAA